MLHTCSTRDCGARPCEAAGVAAVAAVGCAAWNSCRSSSSTSRSPPSSSVVIVCCQMEPGRMFRCWHKVACLHGKHMLLPSPAMSVPSVCSHPCAQTRIAEEEAKTQEPGIQACMNEMWVSEPCPTATQQKALSQHRRQAPRNTGVCFPTPARREQRLSRRVCRRPRGQGQLQGPGVHALPGKILLPDTGGAEHRMKAARLVPRELLVPMALDTHIACVDRHASFPGRCDRAASACAAQSLENVSTAACGWHVGIVVCSSQHSCTRIS